MCAWIYQPTTTLGVDVAATEMHFSDDHPHQSTDDSHFDQLDGKRWLLPLHRIGEEGALVEGQAFAVAIALVLDIDHPEKQRVVWWGQPVDLLEDKARVDEAHDKGLKGDLLKKPAEPWNPRSSPDRDPTQSIVCRKSSTRRRNASGSSTCGMWLDFSKIVHWAPGMRSWIWPTISGVASS